MTFENINGLGNINELDNENITIPNYYSMNRIFKHLLYVWNFKFVTVVSTLSSIICNVFYSTGLR